MLNRERLTLSHVINEMGSEVDERPYTEADLSARCPKCGNDVVLDDASTQFGFEWSTYNCLDDGAKLLVIKMTREGAVCFSPAGNLRLGAA